MKIAELADLVKENRTSIDNLAYKVGELSGQVQNTNGNIKGKDLLKWVCLPLILILGSLVGLDLSGVI